MSIKTEPIGSLPRPLSLLKSKPDLDLQEEVVRETLRELDQTGSPILTDGEQLKPSFLTYPLSLDDNLASGGVVIFFKDGHTRDLPKLVRGPFRYAHYAVEYYTFASRCLRKEGIFKPLKQAVIAPSALSLLYPEEGIADYSREQFLEDLLNEAEKDIRFLLSAGAYKVSLDFTEARLSLKLDSSGRLLKRFLDLNNRLLDRFSETEREKLGVHTCPGGDWDSTHSDDVPYNQLLPHLFELKVGNFYLSFKSESNKKEVLSLIQQYRPPTANVFLGVTDVLTSQIETPEEICNLLLEAANYIPVSYLGSTDDCGFSPFADDTSTSRHVAFQKIRARILGTRLAEAKLTQRHI